MVQLKKMSVYESHKTASLAMSMHVTHREAPVDI